jgi:glycolate oxidase subunit GlcD
LTRVKPTKHAELERELVRALGREYVLSSPIDLAVYECDGETLDAAIPDLVVLPASTEEVQTVVKLANRYKVPVTARGAGTGLSGGATTIMGGISLVLTRLTRVLSIDAENFCAHVQVGVTNVGVSKAAEYFSLYFAPDPSSQYASTIGGNIAENAGGAHTLKYGLTTNNVLGVKLVLPNGEVTTFGGAVRDSLGMDLLGLFVGSEGTIGIATEAWLRLIPRAQAVETMLAFFPSLEDGGQAVSEIVANGVIPAAMEMIDRLTLNCVEDSLALGLNREAAALLIVELDGPNAGILAEREIVEKCVRAHKCMEIKWAKDETERALIWKARKTSFGALGRLAPHGYVLDGVIPRSKLREAITEIENIGKRHNLLVANVYHAGDGNLHPSILYNRDDEEQVQRVLLAAKEILELCVELGGTLSGEHGIGVEKIAEMSFAFAEADLDAMRALRIAFDPELIFNPGKLVPTPKSCGESGARPLLRHRLSAC